ncbi:hypothetical protein Q4603_21715 [Zobellia galactanivorans]|uniref:hypothetical protein n=1 Tax=Zobellia galactanivorans (strain DSM 12802 / CCUG 47099 / CIP 106680 / NCIMB 13871 / Dsij) TaxID=63186 RepID=UPI0026E2E11A|nr:hypothetical protein [Zobellia galactanivorans]MDO6811249.1 hypothetical protein [Zobellia galactanivorans]
MDSQTIITILSVTLPLIGAGVGYLLKSNIEKKKELTNEITKERRAIYQQYVNLMIGIFANTKANKKNNPDKMLTELYEFYKKYVLYASPKVIIAFSDYFQFMYNQNEDEELDSRTHLLFMTKIMAEMRKDLGLKNKNLGKSGEKINASFN